MVISKASMVPPCINSLSGLRPPMVELLFHPLQLCCKILHPYKTVSIFMNFCWIGNNWRIYYLVGPTTDVLRKQPLLNHKLNATEITAVRQLVTGYRESAAFLLRSADELEHLLQIQPKL